jgi:hypothetical protein
LFVLGSVIDESPKGSSMSGQINWVELPAADTAKARAFYGGLFGWTTSEFDGDVKRLLPIRGSTSRPTT